MTDMKALLRFPGERRIAIADCPIPTLFPGTVLVRTEISVISNGTERRQTRQTQSSLLQKAWQRPDLVALTINKLRRDGLSATVNAVNNRLNTPMPTGYANCGIIEAIAPDVTDLKVGQLVACAGLGYANHAQYNIVPLNLVCAVPETVTAQNAAFTTLYAIALHAIRQAEVSIGHQVAVVGCGIIGQLVTQTAMTAGVMVTTIDPSMARRTLSKTVGAIETFSEINLIAPDKFDAVFLCTDDNGTKKLIEAATRLCRDRGIIVCVGDVAANAARETLYRKELTIRQVRSYGPGRYDPNYEELGHDYPIGHVRWTINRNMQAALALMACGKLDPAPLITHEIELEDAADFLSKPSSPDNVATLIRYRQSSPTQEPVRHTHQTIAPTSGTIRIGLIGAGHYLGGTLLPRLRHHQGVTIRMVTSQRGLSALAITRKISGATAVSNADDIFADDTINTVIIATHHDSHTDIAAKALKAGKHVWLEKPLCVNHKQINTLKEVAAQNGPQVFMVGHNRRYAPMATILKAHLPSSPVQYRYQVRTSDLPKDHWLHQPSQGGRTIGEISHFIDLICFLEGTTPIELRCEWIDRKVGHSIWHFVFADGSHGEVSYLQKAGKHTPKEVLEISAPGFDAKLTDWRKLDIHGKSPLHKRNWLGPNKGQSDAITCFIRAIRDGAHDTRMPGLHAEISLMDMILTAAENG